MARALSPSCSVRFSAQEEESSEYEICPYDKNHRVSYSRMEKHVLSCRRQWKMSKLAKDEPIPTFICKYNSNHLVEAPEISYHEDHCQDRHKERDYQIIAAAQASGLPDEDNLLSFPPNDTQMNEGWYIDTFIGGASWSVPIPFEVVGRKRVKLRVREFYEVPGDHQSDNVVGKTAGECSSNRVIRDDDAAYSYVSESEVSSVSDMMSCVSSISCASTIRPDDRDGQFVEAKEAGAAAKIKEEEEENDNDDDWEKGANRPTFNYMENIMNPNRPMLRYPPCLTKSERKKFAEWNSAWFKAIVTNQNERERLGVQSFDYDRSMEPAPVVLPDHIEINVADFQEVLSPFTPAVRRESTTTVHPIYDVGEPEMLFRGCDRFQRRDDEEEEEHEMIDAGEDE